MATKYAIPTGQRKACSFPTLPARMAENTSFNLQSKIGGLRTKMHFITKQKRSLILSAMKTQNCFVCLMRKGKNYVKMCRRWSAFSVKRPTTALPGNKKEYSLT